MATKKRETFRNNRNRFKKEFAKKLTLLIREDTELGWDEIILLLASKIATITRKYR